MPNHARLLLLLTLICGVISPAGADNRGYVTYRSESSFETVLEGLKAAILERGLYINNVMDIGEMQERTGKDLGLGEPIYEHARSIEFCSAVLSRAMMKEDPARIINCPFIISVYQRADEKGTTYVAHREIPAEEQAGSPAMTQVAAMLADLANAAVAW